MSSTGSVDGLIEQCAFIVLPIRTIAIVGKTSSIGYRGRPAHNDNSTGNGNVSDCTMGLSYNTYLTSNKIYGCKSCKTHLANVGDIVSRVRPRPPAHPQSRRRCGSLANLEIELQRSTRQSISLPYCRQRRCGRGERAQHDDRSPHCS